MTKKEMIIAALGKEACYLKNGKYFKSALRHSKCYIEAIYYFWLVYRKLDHKFTINEVIFLLLI